MALVSNGKRHVTNVKKHAKMFALSGWTQIAVFCAYGETQEYCISLINLVLVNAGHLQWSFANGYKRREFTITILS